jgi:hypothetical protein
MTLPFKSGFYLPNNESKRHSELKCMEKWCQICSDITTGALIMRYDELSPLASQVIEKAGVISDPLKVDLENMMIECNSENHFLNSMLDYVEIIQDDPLEYLNNTDYNNSTDLSSFKKSIDDLHNFIIKVISVPLNSRNQSSL